MSHHTGASEQHVAEQALAKKINGVPIQCIIHNVLDIIPKLSYESEYLIFIFSKI